MGSIRSALRHQGVQSALLSALMFGAGAPAAKLLLGGIDPWLLAGLLYVGSGLGLLLIRLVRRDPWPRLRRDEWPWLLGAIACGGVVGPVLLMVGLAGLPASGASLLLNAESVLTAVIAWVAFKENVDRRILLGMVLITAGAVVISVPGRVELGTLVPSLAILGACLAWGVDNNLTRKVSLTDATWLAMIKGLVAGPANFALAMLVGASLPTWPLALGGMALGLVAYGLSLALFIVALRHVGTARAGAYYSVAPFFGAVLGLALGEPVTWAFVIATVLMTGGVWLHLTERHEHLHTHEPLTHTHFHRHDDGHHDHAHDGPVPALGHAHPHTHDHRTHSHEHYPDAHHRHAHA